MSIKNDPMNQYLIFMKTNIFRLDLIQGLIENDNVKIRLLVDDLDKTLNSNFSIFDNFESLRKFDFQLSDFNKEYLNFKLCSLYNLIYYEKFLQRNKDFNGKKAIIFLEDFLIKKENINYNTLENAKKLPVLDQGGISRNILQFLNKFNFILYSDFLYFKSWFNYYLDTEKTEDNLKFHLQLYYLLRALKLANVESMIIADGKKYENTFEGLLIKALLSSYGIRYKFVNFKYYGNDKNYCFIFPLKFLVYKNKKFIYMKYTLKQIYEKNINDYYINYQLLQEAFKSATIDNNLSLNKFKDFEMFSEEECFEESKEIKDVSKNSIYHISQFLIKLKFDFIISKRKLIVDLNPKSSQGIF